MRNRYIILISFLIIMLFILFVPSHSYSQTTSRPDVNITSQPLSTGNVENLDRNENIGTLFVSRKDPFLAGFFSFLMMGTGHFYTGKYQKGSLFLFADILLKSAFVGLVLHLKSEYTTETKDTVYWKDLRATDRGVVIGFGILYAVILMLNVSDAIESAHEYNRRYLRESRFQFSLDSSNSCFKLVMAARF
jgi:hypothetical protein